MGFVDTSMAVAREGDAWVEAMAVLLEAWLVARSSVPVGSLVTVATVAVSVWRCKGGHGEGGGVEVEHMIAGLV